MNEETTLKVPIPPRLQTMPQHMGLPIPYSTFTHPVTGVPDFKVTDHEKWKNCAYQNRCGLCGQPNPDFKYFIGGGASLESGFFYDPPMHEECARYAAAVCPFIAHGKGYGKLPTPPEGTALQVHPWDEKPKVMGFLVCADYCMRPAPGLEGLFFKALNIVTIERITPKTKTP